MTSGDSGTVGVCFSALRNMLAIQKFSQLPNGFINQRMSFVVGFVVVVMTEL